MYGGGDWNSAKDALIQQVKEYQRTGAAYKAAWDNFCKENGSNKFDPSKKDEDFLQNFLDSVAVGQIKPDEEAAASSYGGQQKASLVDAVKQWQRKGESHKQAWWDWCRQQGTQDYDPNRHDARFLQRFLKAADMGMVNLGPHAGYSKGKGKGKDSDGVVGMALDLIKGLMKGGKGGGGKGKRGGGGPPQVGLIRYDDPMSAQHALETLNGSYLMGSPITVEVDPSSAEGTKLVVHGVPGGCAWQELKDHFKECGVVAYAGFREDAGSFGGGGDPYGIAALLGGGGGGGGGGGRGGSYGRSYGGEPKIGEIRYDDSDHAATAVLELHNSRLGGSIISVEYDANQRSGDMTKLVIGNVPGNVQWQELKDHFKQIGTVAFAGFKNDAKGGFGPMKGGGKGKAGGGYSPY